MTEAEAKLLSLVLEGEKINFGQRGYAEHEKAMFEARAAVLRERVTPEVMERVRGALVAKWAAERAAEDALRGLPRDALPVADWYNEWVATR